MMILNARNQILVGRRLDHPSGYWQMPQGGVDRNEKFLDAALRELEEETSVKNVDLIKEIEGYQTYFLPENLLGIIWRGKYRGQRQKWFCMKFIGKDTEINIKTKKPEFSEWRWVDIDEITNHVVDFKTEVYKNLKLEVKKIIIN